MHRRTFYFVNSLLAVFARLPLSSLPLQSSSVSSFAPSHITQRIDQHPVSNMSSDALVSLSLSFLISID
jgi:hypothetical protein